MATNRYFQRQLGTYSPVVAPIPFDQLLQAGMMKQQQLDNTRLGLDEFEAQAFLNPGKSTVDLARQKNALYSAEAAKLAEALNDPNQPVNDISNKIRSINSRYKSDKGVSLVKEDFALKGVADKTEAEQLFQAGEYESDYWDHGNNRWKQFTQADVDAGATVGAGRYTPMYDGDFFKENQVIIDQIKPDVQQEVDNSLGIINGNLVIDANRNIHTIDEATSNKRRQLTQVKLAERLGRYVGGLSDDLSGSDLPSVRFRTKRGSRTNDPYNKDKYLSDLMNQGQLGIFDEDYSTQKETEKTLRDPAKGDGSESPGMLGGFTGKVSAKNSAFKPFGEVQNMADLHRVTTAGDKPVDDALVAAGFARTKDGAITYANGNVVTNQDEINKVSGLINEIQDKQKRLVEYNKRVIAQIDAEQKAAGKKTYSELIKTHDPVAMEKAIDAKFPSDFNGIPIEKHLPDFDENSSMWNSTNENIAITKKDLKARGYTEGVDYTFRVEADPMGGSHELWNFTQEGLKKAAPDVYQDIRTKAQRAFLDNDKETADVLERVDTRVKEDLAQIAASNTGIMLNYNIDPSVTSGGNLGVNKSHQELVRYVQNGANMGRLPLRGPDGKSVEGSLQDLMPSNYTPSDFKPDMLYMDRDEKGDMRWYVDGTFVKDGVAPESKNAFGKKIDPKFQKSLSVDVTDIIDDITGLQEAQQFQVLGHIKDAMLLTRPGEAGTITLPQPAGAPSVQIQYKELSGNAIELTGQIVGLDENGQVVTKEIKDVLKEEFDGKTSFRNAEEASQFMLQAWESAKNASVVNPYRFDDNGQVIPRDVPKDVTARKDIVLQEAEKMQKDYPGYNGNFAEDFTELIAFESGNTFDPGQRNMSDGKAIGLIQFYPDKGTTEYKTIGGKKYQFRDLANMSIPEQMDVANKYLKDTGKTITNKTDLYFAVFYPEFVGMDPSTPVLQAFINKHGYEKGTNRYYEVIKDNKAYAEAEVLADIPSIVYGS